MTLATQLAGIWFANMFLMGLLVIGGSHLALSAVGLRWLSLAAWSVYGATIVVDGLVLKPHVTGRRASR